MQVELEKKTSGNITSDKDKAYVDYVGHNYIIIKDIFTHEPIEIYVGEHGAKVWKKECSDGETIYVFYDKENKILMVCI